MKIKDLFKRDNAMGKTIEDKPAQVCERRNFEMWEQKLSKYVEKCKENDIPVDLCMSGAKGLPFRCFAEAAFFKLNISRDFPIIKAKVRRRVKADPDIHGVKSVQHAMFDDFMETFEIESSDLPLNSRYPIKAGNDGYPAPDIDKINEMINNAGTITLNDYQYKRYLSILNANNLVHSCGALTPLIRYFIMKDKITENDTYSLFEQLQHEEE